MRFKLANQTTAPAISALKCTTTALYVAGNFNQVNTTNQSYLASLSLTSGTLNNWQSEPANGSNITGLRNAGNGVFALAGDYYKSKRAIGMALLNPVTQEPVDKNFDFLLPNPNGTPSTGYGVQFTTVAVKDNILWVGGAESSPYRAFVSAYNISTTDRINTQPITFTGGEPRRLVAADSLVYVSGTFTGINGQPSRQLAAISANGNLQSFSVVAEPYSQFQDCIKDFKIMGNLMYLCGTFTSINGMPRKYLACVNRTTGQLTDWNPDPDQAVNKIEIIDKFVYFSGYQSRVGTQPPPAEPLIS